MPEIRRATEEDVAAILAISNWAAANTHANFAVEPESLASWTESFRETSETHPWLVAVDEGDGVVGFAKASPWKGRCAYTYSVEITVYLHPDHQGRGLGRALYGRLLPILTRQGYQTALGGIALPNDASVRLHESFGMVCTGVFRRVGWKHQRWHDVGYWQAMLQAPDTTPPDRLRTVTEVGGESDEATGGRGDR